MRFDVFSWVARRGLFVGILLRVVWPAQAEAQAEAPVVVLPAEGLRERWRSNDDANDDLVELVNAYRSTGAALPRVLSVWTDFPMLGSSLGTLYIPLGNATTGIGLETRYDSPDGTLVSNVPPLDAILLHNDIDTRAGAERHGAPNEGYGRYLFLLELSHLWGPQLQVPDGLPPLLGFDFHWSYFLDAVSPAGGNAWEDLGDGRFRARLLDPGAVTFSPLDLYIMGLVPPEEVPPVRVLTNVRGTEAYFDPLWQRAGLSGETYPHMNPEIDVVVEADVAEVTIDDVLRENGMRSPAFGEEPTEIPIAFALVVDPGTSAAERVSLARRHQAFFEGLVSDYADATGGRGSLRPLAFTTLPTEPSADAGVPDAGVPDAGPLDGGEPPLDAGPGASMDVGGGCAAGAASPRTALALGLIAFGRRRFSPRARG